MNVCRLLTFWFLAPLADGQLAYVMVRCPSFVRVSVHLPVYPCINFFKHLSWNYASNFDETSQDLSCQGPYQNSFKELDSNKNWLPWKKGI